MTRSDLVVALAGDHPELSTAETQRIVTCIFDAISDCLSAGGRVELRGFGTFSTRARGGRDGRNPHTGDAVEVRAKRVPYFKAGKRMLDRLNPARPGDDRDDERLRTTRKDLHSDHGHDPHTRAAAPRRRRCAEGGRL